jgi:alpha-beta hydrolase superfamily lysophospholipase
MSGVTRALKRLGRYLIVAVLGFIGGVAGIYVYWVRSGPPLELWHTEELSAEFTADGSVRSFEEYLSLEDRLFEQLDEKIYSRTETGPQFALARYSAGSAADPSRWPTNWNRSFELPVDDPLGGVLLLHGMSDSPYSLRVLGESLHQRGYWVVGARMPGHGTAPSGFTSIRWEDLAAVVRMGMEHLASRAGPDSIHIAGYSTGAPLALEYTLRAMDGNGTVPASLVLISPAIGVTPAAALASWFGKLAVVPGLEKLAWTTVLPEFDPFKYNSFTANAAEQVHRLSRFVANEVEARSTSGPLENFPPTLVLLSTVDATVSVDAVIDNLLEHLAPGSHELVLFDINRRSVKSTILVDAPGPLTMRLMGSEALPFALTLVTNENGESAEVVSRRKRSLSSHAETERLNLAWPRGTISLSHVALPFPPEDPLYGRVPSANADIVFLGQLPIKGERGLLLFPADWLLRLRHNPFYPYLEERALEWVSRHRTAGGGGR